MILSIGRWVLPCASCDDSKSCYWREAVWAPYSCHYNVLSRKDTRTCLANKKVGSHWTVNLIIREQYSGIHPFLREISRKKRENVVGKMTVYTKICTIPDRQLKYCFDKLVFLQFSKLLVEFLKIVFVLFWCRFCLLETPPIVASCITLWKRWEGNFAIFEPVKKC